MTDKPDDAQWGDINDSFLGQIYLVRDEQCIPLRLSRADDRFTWTGVESHDWLQAGGQEASPVFKFVFHSRTDDRIHVHVLGTGSHSGKKLGISRNGYLGLYRVAEVVDHLKLEPLNWEQDLLRCRLRDHLGHQVKAEPDHDNRKVRDAVFLTTGEGAVHDYVIRRV
ncbi:hypothetical protein G7009_14870 [Pseudomonas capeferrum]|uniref:hypothetical protein n=1 Tax=Pseudomonas capeferrum TaxID=1495066 RepID=UPI0015E2C382|nr:hypothetical protein [Pseudomonas capeferrum]MBA1203022.1 hypothetical protein [Pseudomonas capeferrum]